MLCSFVSFSLCRLPVESKSSLVQKLSPFSNERRKTEMMSNSPAEPEYERAKTSIWWDIENCPVPKGLNAHVISQNISSALMKLNYCGPLSISSYGNTNLIPNSVQIALSSTGISLNHVPSGRKDASDKKILVDMFLWVLENPAPANLMLISGDGDFSDALHRLKMKRYNILLAHPQQASPSLVASTNTTWIWTSLLDGCSSLIPCESSPLLGTAHFSRDSEVISGAVSEHVLSRQKLLKNCCEKSETAWLCKVCNGTCKIFDTLTLHLSSKEHAAQWEPKQNTTFFGELENMAAEPSDCHEKDVEMKNKMVDAGVEANVRCGLCREVCPCQTSLDSHPKNAALVKKQPERESERSGGEFCQDFKETLESDCVVPLNFDCASLDFGLPKEVRDAIVKELEPSQNEIVIENLEGVLKQDLQMKSGEPKYAHVVMNEHLEEEINEKKRSRRRKKKSTMIKDGAETFNCSICSFIFHHPAGFESHLKSRKHAAKIKKHTEKRWEPVSKEYMDKKKEKATRDKAEGEANVYSICSVVCDFPIVFESHLMGRRHSANVKKHEEVLFDDKKILEESLKEKDNPKDGLEYQPEEAQESIKQVNESEAVPKAEPAIAKGNLECVEAKEERNREGLERLKLSLEEDTSKEKASEDEKRSEIRVCKWCNVRSTSQIDFDSHLAGKKHAAKVKKYGVSVTKKGGTYVRKMAPTGYTHSNPHAYITKGNLECVEPTEEERNREGLERLKLSREVDTSMEKASEGEKKACEIRVCKWCNVRSASKIDFDSHLAGKKHAARVKTYAASVKTYAASVKRKSWAYVRKGGSYLLHT